MKLLAAALLALAASAPAPIARDLLVVLNKSEASVSLLDVETAEVVATLPVGVGPHEAATSPDGKLVVVCNYGQRDAGSTLTVLDPHARKVVRTIDLVEFHRPHGIQWTPDGAHVVVTAEVEQRLLLVDPHSGEVIDALPTEQAASHMVALEPLGRFAYVANIGAGSMTVIDLVGRARVKSVPTGAGAEGIAVHPQRPEVWVTNRAADTVSVVDRESLEVVAQIDCGTFPIRVAFTPEGKHALVSCANSGDLAVIDVETRAVARRIPMAEAKLEDGEERLFGESFGQSPVPVGVLVRPDGKRAYVANTNADVLTVIDLESWQRVGRLRAGKEPDGMAWVRAREDG